LIKLKIPELLKEHHMSASALMRKGDIAYATALRIAKGEAQSISFDLLNRLCILFGVGVDGILEYVPDENQD
jgi:DNA-binding Xre family transcriptional regulator